MNRFFHAAPAPFLLCFLLLFSGKPGCQEAPEEDIVLDKEAWRVGISSFQGDNLQDRQLYLLDSLPQLLKEEFSDLSEHALSEEERRFLAEEYLEEKIVASGSSIDSLHNQRDGLLFSSQAEKDREERYLTLSEDILEGMRNLQEWLNKDPGTIEIAESLPIEYVDTNLPPPESQAGLFLEKKTLDMLITGRVDRLEDIFFLELSCYNRTEGKAAFSWSGAGGEAELNSLIIDAAREFRSDLLGRSWTELTVSAEPADSIIRLDGETIGVGTVTLASALPGFRTLKVSHNGYVTEIRQVYLPSMERADYSFVLDAGEAKDLSFFSVPPGADVYYGAQWMGRTPLVLPEPPFHNDIKIALDGYTSFHAPSNGLEGESVTVIFEEKAYDKQQAFDEAKSRFYRSLGWFSLSMGAPLVLYGIYQNQYNLYDSYATRFGVTRSQSDYDRAIEYRDSSERLYYSFLGGMAISGGLLIHTLFRLNDYIKAADESTRN